MGIYCSYTFYLGNVCFDVLRHFIFYRCNFKPAIFGSSNRIYCSSFSIALTNGGIGAYPLAVYAAFLIFDVAEGPSLAFGWIMWTSQTVMLVVLGGISLILLPFYNKFIQSIKNKLWYTFFFFKISLTCGFQTN